MDTNAEAFLLTSVDKIRDEFSSVLDSFDDPQKRAFFVDLLNQHPINYTMYELQEQTPLKFCARIGDITYELVEHLLKKKPNLEEYGNPVYTPSRRRTALHVAAESGAVLIAQLLLKCGAKVNSRDADGRTPLHLATMNFQKSMITLLLDRGATRDAKDLDGRTPIELIEQSMWGKPIEECAPKVVNPPIKVEIQEMPFEMNNQPVNPPMDPASFDYAQMQYWNNASMQGVPPSFNYPPMYYLPMQPNWNAKPSTKPQQFAVPKFEVPPQQYATPMSWEEESVNEPPAKTSRVETPTSQVPFANNFQHMPYAVPPQNWVPTSMGNQVPNFMSTPMNYAYQPSWLMYDQSAAFMQGATFPPSDQMSQEIDVSNEPNIQKPKKVNAVPDVQKPQFHEVPIVQKPLETQAVKQEPVSTTIDEIPFDPVTRMYVVKSQKKVSVQEVDDSLDDDIDITGL